MICLFGEDEQQYSEHDAAWFGKDWEAVQKLADSYKEKQQIMQYHGQHTQISLKITMRTSRKSGITGQASSKKIIKQTIAT